MPNIPLHVSWYVSLFSSRRRHTRCSRDWSSDVCSSDLQVASVSVADARALSVTPWDKAMVQPIEKAIMESGLGLNPNTSGQVIRVPLPALTEERRKDFGKLVRKGGEEAKIAVRNV